MAVITALLNCFLLTLISIFPVACSQTRDDLLVHTTNGTVRGRSLPEFHQDLFLGLPFANAPRLENPTSINQSWSGVRDASIYGPTCIGLGSNLLLNLTLSEDCLNLNVIRPASTHIGQDLPVLVWIYGGGFDQGSTADPMWNLSYIVQTSSQINQPIIAVSINYRLSFLGFPAGQEVLDSGVTNLGLKDQRIALQWIQENIHAFGGDPRKVTIWGESGGAASVTNQIVAYGGQGGSDLFRAGMMVSGFAFGINLGNATGKTFQAGYDAIVSATNCTNSTDTLACLRTAPLSAITSVEETVASWGPVVDGSFIRTTSASEIELGNFAHVPILLGANSDEGLFIVNTLGIFPNDTSQVLAVLQLAFPNVPNTTFAETLSAYPFGAPAPPYSLPPDYPWCAAMAAVNLTCSAQYRRLAAILGDYFSAAPRRWMAEQWASHNLPAYSFRFDTDPTSIPIVYWNGLGPGFAIHGAELAYEFGLPGGFTTPIDFYPPVKNISTHEMLSHEMNVRWILFANRMDPNSGVRGTDDGIVWPNYDEGPKNMVFNATDHLVNVHVEVDDYREKGIDIFLGGGLDYYAMQP